MPFMDGKEATIKIRSLTRNFPPDMQPKIFAVTGHVEEEYYQNCMKCGMDQVYCKPLAIYDFAQILLNMKFIDSIPSNIKLEEDGN